jgi:hypothetical protein
MMDSGSDTNDIFTDLVGCNQVERERATTEGRRVEPLAIKASATCGINYVK